MAKFVIAGKANCPYFAKAELVGDKLQRSLPDFRIHKIVIDPDEWDDWLRDVCRKNNWKHSKSPIVWRELVERGGKGMLLGDANDFLEYTKGYYGVSTDLLTSDLKKISDENYTSYQKFQENSRREQASINPIIVSITYPQTPILQFIIPEMLSGNVFGAGNEISLRLFCENPSKSVDGIRMEIEDLAGSKLRYIQVVHDPKEAFLNSDYVILLDELNLIENEEDSGQFYNPYVQLARLIDEHAKSSCKILISPFGSRSETYALVNVFSKYLTRIDPRKQLIGNSMCDEMLAKAVLAHRLRVNPAYVKNVLLIGQNLGESFYIDLTHGKVTDYDGAVWAKKNTHWLNLVNMVADKDWMQKEFPNLVSERSRQISALTNRSAVFTFAQSVIKLMSLWSSSQTEDDSLYSAIVYSDNNYSIRDEVFISLPVRFDKGTFTFSNSYRIGRQTTAVISEIIKDTKKKISNRYKEDVFVKDSQELKISIPNVLIID